MQKNESIKGVSIVICCYNSTTRLPETLKYISLQKVTSHIPWEVIVIDNASKDNTSEVAGKIWESLKCNVPFQIIEEPNAGLSYARHRGFVRAKYNFVLFCDDDNWLSEDYVQTVYEVMSNNDSIGALGGNGECVCEVPPPSWYYRYSALVYASGEQGEKSGEVPSSRGALYGAGSAFRKSAYNKLIQHGFCSKLTDRKGKELSSGGDTELSYVYRLMGYKLWYDTRLRFKHFIPKERLQWSYLRRFYISSVKTTNVLVPYTKVLEGEITSVNGFNRYSSFGVLWDIIEGHLIPYYRKRISAYFGNNPRIDGLEQIMVFYFKMRAKYLLKFWEYNKNLLEVIKLRDSFQKSN